MKIEYITRYVGFDTFAEMAAHIEANKYRYDKYEVTGHGWSKESKHYYEVRE